MGDLNGLVRQQIIEQVIKASGDGFKVLVVDAYALGIVSAACSMFDLTENDVLTVEELGKARQPHPDQPAVYLCYPAVANVQIIEKDFTPKPKYLDARIFFVDAAEDAVIGAIGRSATLKPHVKSLVELNMHFVPRGDRTFSLDAPQGLHEFYSPKSHGTAARDVAKQIASVCAAVGEVPVVRFGIFRQVCRARKADGRPD